SSLLPVPRRLAKASPRQKSLSLAVDPAPKARPAPDQRLVGKFSRALTGRGVTTYRDQAVLGERLEHHLEFGRVLWLHEEFAHFDPPTRVLRALSWLNEPEEQTL